jgi:L-ascorbate metabolism protein UlaG (beta-lactamase superfamily)
MSGLVIRYLGQSGFQLTKGDSTILIDPASKKAGDIEGDLVYCTHRHFDHTGGIQSFLERNPEALLLTNIQVSQKFRQFKERTVLAREGESFHHGHWGFWFIESMHGLVKNELNLGVIVRNGDDSFGHCGDTVTFEGFSSAEVDTLAVPIIGMFTASPSRAISELKKFDHPLPIIVVMHWMFRNPYSFCESLSKEIRGVRCIVPEKGELLPL